MHLVGQEKGGHGLTSERDLHRALKIETLGHRQVQGADFLLVRLQDGKDDISHSLHARVTIGMIGILLNHLGFQKKPCQFTGDGQCFCKALGPEITLDTFFKAFEEALASFRQAEQALGQFLDPTARRVPAGFDGHRGTSAKFLKGLDEGAFRFLLSWIETPQGKGWVRHVRVREASPFDADHLLTNVLHFETFDSCPDFDFEPCYWTFAPQAGPDPVAAQMIHAAFDRMPQTFPAALSALAAVEDAMQPAGMAFPRALRPTLKKLIKIADVVAAKALQAPSARPAIPLGGYEFDVAVSFAGSERAQAENLAAILKKAGVKVFYDKDHPDKLWGEDMTVALDRIYGKDARFFVPFVSSEYASRDWPRHELKSARARALREKGAYILPIQVDPGVELEGVPETIGYLSRKEYSLEQIADILLKKLGHAPTPTKPVKLVTDAIPGLTPADSLVLRLLGEKALAHGGRFIHYPELPADAQKAGIPEVDLADALEILASRGYLRGRQPNLELAHFGFDQYMRHYALDYGERLETVCRAIVDKGEKENHEIASSSGIPLVLVNHILDDLKRQGLAEVLSMLGGRKTVHSTSAELRRRLRR